MITYHLNADAHLVTFRVTTDLRVLDVGGCMERLLEDPAFDAGHNMLVLIDQEAAAPDLIARNALAELLVSWRKLHAPAKVGFVLSGSAWRRIADQLIEEYGLGTRNVRCFAAPAEAILWFKENAEAAAGV